MRTIYLQSSLSINGQHALRGRVLVDRLRRESDDFLLGALIYEQEHAVTVPPRIRPDVISEVQLLTFDPTVIFCEGGLVTGRGGGWKVTKLLADRFVRGGGTLIVADVDRNVLYDEKREYQEAGAFLGARASYRGPEPVMGNDQRSYWRSGRQIVCRTEKMIVSDWLRPIYDGVPEIVCGIPVQLSAWGDILASGNTDSTQMEVMDEFLGLDSLPWASVHRSGAGFVVLLAGSVTPDAWLEGSRHNTTWLTNICRFLSDAAKDERTRSQSVIRSDESVFFSHATSDKSVVAAVHQALTGEHAVGTWLDARDLLPGDSLPDHIDSAIGRSTAFVLFWSHAAARSQWVRRELAAAMAAPNPTVVLVRLDDAEPPEALQDLLWIDAAGATPDTVADKLAATIRRRHARAWIEDARERGAAAAAAAARREALARVPDYPDDASLTRGRAHTRVTPTRPLALAGALSQPAVLATVRSSFRVDVLSFVDDGILVSGSGSPDRADLANARRLDLIAGAAHVNCPTGMDGHLDDHRSSGRHLVYGNRDVRIVDRSRGEVAAVINCEDEAGVISAAWSPAGDRVVIASTNSLTIADDRGTVILHRNMAVDDEGGGPPRSVVWQPSLNPVYTNGRRIEFADPDGRTIRLLDGLDSPAVAVAVSPNGSRIAGSARDGGVVVWSEWGELLLKFDGVTGDGWSPARCLAFSPDGRFLAQAATNGGGTFVVLDLTTGRRAVVPHDDASLTAFHPTRADVLATAARDTITFWQLGTAAADGPAWNLVTF